MKIDWESWGAHLLALVIWREARGEGRTALEAVAWCIRNRVDRPTWWGKGYAEVICKKWQFSSMTDPRDKQLGIWPRPNDPAFTLCLEVAGQVIEGEVSHPMPCADSYYDTSIAAPKWATADTFVGVVGSLRFYNLDRDHEAAVTGIEQLAQPGFRLGIPAVPRSTGPGAAP